jgi:hypothetical protein
MPDWIWIGPSWIGWQMGTAGGGSGPLLSESIPASPSSAPRPRAQMPRVARPTGRDEAGRECGVNLTPLKNVPLMEQEPIDRSGVPAAAGLRSQDGYPGNLPISTLTGSQADSWISTIAAESSRGTRTILLRARQSPRSNCCKRINQHLSPGLGLRAIRPGRPSCPLSAWSWSWVSLS